MTKAEHNKVITENPIGLLVKHMGLPWEIEKMDSKELKNGEFIFKFYLKEPSGDTAKRGADISIETLEDYNAMF